MGRRRPVRIFRVHAKHATSPDAPTLEQVQADAAPIIAQMLARAISKCQKEESA